MQPGLRPLPRQRRLRGALLGLWNFVVTAATFGLFAVTWFATVAALSENDIDMLYLAAAATVVVTPLALHRLMGSRGSLRFALFASIIASIATVYLVADGGRREMETVLAALFMGQLVAVIFAEILTRRTPEDPLDEELMSFPRDIS